MVVVLGPEQEWVFKSIRGAYIREEVDEILKELNPDCYQIKNEMPFLLSVIIRKHAV
jgi:hypothetical protein